jgi:hypothetical protein
MATTLQKVTFSITPKDAQGNPVDIFKYKGALTNVVWAVDNPDFDLLPAKFPGGRVTIDPSVGGPVDLVAKDPAVGGTAVVSVSATNSVGAVLREEAPGIVFEVVLPVVASLGLTASEPV